MYNRSGKKVIIPKPLTTIQKVNVQLHNNETNDLDSQAGSYQSYFTPEKYKTVLNSKYTKDYLEKERSDGDDKVTNKPCYEKPIQINLVYCLIQQIIYQQKLVILMNMTPKHLITTV